MEEISKEKYAKPSKQKYMKLEEAVDDKTVIPEMPKEILKEPNFDELKAKVQKMKDQRQKLFDQQKLFIQDTISNIKSKKSETRVSVAPLMQDLEIKVQKNKQLQALFDKAREELDAKNKAYEQQYERTEQIKQKMKTHQGTVEEIQAEINGLKNILSDQKVTVKQEKDHVARISQLESLLPFAAQNDMAKKILKERLQEKKEAQSAYFKVKDETKELRDSINKIRDNITELSSMTEEEKKLVQPKIDQKRAEIQAKVDELNTAIESAHQKFETDKNNYQNQKKLIERIEWMKKEQKAFIKNKKEQEREESIKQKKAKELEEFKVRQELLEKELAEDTYDENVSICKLLIEYCKKLMPKQERSEQITINPVDVEKLLNTKEWKKDNVSIIPSKTKIDDEVKTGKKKQPKKKSEVFLFIKIEVDERVNHNIEVLNYFAHVLVSPPLFIKNMEETVKLLEEKKTYFQNLPKESKPVFVNIQETSNMKDRKNNKKHQIPTDLENAFPIL